MAIEICYQVSPEPATEDDQITAFVDGREVETASVQVTRRGEFLCNEYEIDSDGLMVWGRTVGLCKSEKAARAWLLARVSKDTPERIR